MRSFCIILFICCTTLSLEAQRKQSPTTQLMMQLEENMRNYAFDIVNAPETAERAIADSFFTRSLVKALQVPYSFAYPFDSLQTISHMYAPDSSFRIFTWQIMKDFTYYRYKGAIQFHTKDGSLQLLPLYDYSAFTENPVDSIRDNEHWIGCVYYNIVQKTFNNKNYYTLIGYDENDARSTRKWMEVLTFDEKNKPNFGGRFFSYPNDNMKPPQPAYRFYLEFKKDANAKMNYDAELDMITFVHLISEVGDTNAKYTLIPMGTFEGFKWQNGKWVYVPTVREIDPRSNINPQKEPIFQPKKKKG